jgi:hypothetical protein
MFGWLKKKPFALLREDAIARIGLITDLGTDRNYQRLLSETDEGDGMHLAYFAERVRRQDLYSMTNGMLAEIMNRPFYRHRKGDKYVVVGD